ncbi:MAG: uL14 family ribosomal protein [Candidatus Pacearchaeota archaeon]|nr:MAG: uL14 family ribosomal protein [Candidatus Pacearchaeota archaeon]
MKATAARIVKGINIGALINVADNSGAKIVRIIGVKRGKGRKGRQIACGVADLVRVSVRKGTIAVRKQVFFAVVVRQKKEYRRNTGERISFFDNAVVILKDKEGNPKGTQIKGPIAREAADRWPFVSRVANLIV